MTKANLTKMIDTLTRIATIHLNNGDLDKANTTLKKADRVNTQLKEMV